MASREYVRLFDHVIREPELKDCLAACRLDRGRWLDQFAPVYVQYQLGSPGS
jgi:hypothetical protein